MRLILGILIGCALTVGVAYISDASVGSEPEAKRMVNWDVVAKRVDGVTEAVRQGWRRIAG
jgi:hypothetical protein